MTFDADKLAAEYFPVHAHLQGAGAELARVAHRAGLEEAVNALATRAHKEKLKSYGGETGTVVDDTQYARYGAWLHACDLVRALAQKGQEPKSRADRLRELGYTDERPDGGCADALGLRRIVQDELYAGCKREIIGGYPHLHTWDTKTKAPDWLCVDCGAIWKDEQSGQGETDG